MSQDLRMDPSDAGPFLKIQISGTLNEALIPEHLAELADGRPVRFDLENVSRITSFGVRQWLRGLASLRERSAGVVFERCSYPCVSQMNLIAGFSADALIVSVMAPLSCETCKHEKLIAVDVSNGPPAALEQPCEICGGKADLEEDLESYFAFAKSHSRSDDRLNLYAQLKSADEVIVATKAANEQRAKGEAAAAERRAQEERILRDAGRRPRDELASRTLQAMHNAKGRGEREVRAERPAQPAPPAPKRQNWEATANFDLDDGMGTVDELEEISAAELVDVRKPRHETQKAVVSVDLERLASLLAPGATAQASQTAVMQAVESEREPTWFDRYGVFIFAFGGGVLFGFVLGRL